MLTEAIAKLNAEIEGNNTNPNVLGVGQFLLSYVQQHPQAAEKVLAADKTIMKSLEDMRKVADTRKVGGMAFISDAEGFAIVLKYFGIEGAAVTASVQTGPTFDVQLDDLL